MISKNYASGRRNLIDPLKSATRFDPGDLEDGDTIYLTVADKDGNSGQLIRGFFIGDLDWGWFLPN